MALMSVNTYSRCMGDRESAGLSAVKRQAVVDHVLIAARRYVLANGLDATMDDLAEATGVSRRTLFRHFGSRERLLAAGFETGMANYLDNLPPFDGDLDAWLRLTCAEVHRMNATIGPGFFDLASRPDLAPELAAVEVRRRNDFREAMASVAQTLWTAAGAPPPALIMSVTAHLSPHFTAAVTIDVGETWDVAAELAFTAISAAVGHTSGSRPQGAP